MAKTFRYPVFVMESYSGLFTGMFLDEDLPTATGDSGKEVLFQLKEYLDWKAESLRWMEDPAFLEPRIMDMRIQVTPAYVRNERNFPCSETLAISYPCVYGREPGGMFRAMLPTLGVRFGYYEQDTLKALAQHFAAAKLSGMEPLGLAGYLPVKSRVLTEIVVTLKHRAKPGDRKAWHEDEALEALAIAAEPLSLKKVRGEYAHACLRDKEVQDLYDRLRTKRVSVLLVGEPGAGKTTILGKVARLIDRDASQQAGHKTYRLWNTSAQRIIAGMRYLGQWEERCEKLVGELSGLGGTLCVNNLLELVRTGGQGPLDSVGALLAHYMRKGELTMVAEATPAELDACRRLLPGFAELFQLLTIEPFNETDAKSVLKEMSDIVSRNLQLAVEPAVPAMIYRLFSRFAPYAAFPGQAVSFLINTFDKAGEQKKTLVTRDLILNAFARQSGLPELFLRDEKPLERSEVLDCFKARVIGQERGCSAAADVVTRFKSGMNDPARPVSVLIFCGPTGVGKTALARALSDYFFGHGDESDRLIRLDMSEYGGYGGAARLVTAPDGGPSDFIKRMRRQPFSLVLLDEIEKANPQVFDVLMNVFDEGRLADPYGRVTSFRSAIIIMTSNLGATKKGSLGFCERPAVYEDAVKNYFRPEFFNRMDGVVTFDALPDEIILKIAGKELRDLAGREGLKEYGIKLAWSEEVVAYIAKVGFDARYGARPLQRALETFVVTPIARLLSESPELRNVQLRLEMGKDGRIAVTAG